jgi:hypothetical protein
MQDDTIMLEVRKEKAKVAEKIGGQAFENYLPYLQTREKELERAGFKFFDPKIQPQEKQETTA